MYESLCEAENHAIQINLAGEELSLRFVKNHLDDIVQILIYQSGDD